MNKKLMFAAVAALGLMTAPAYALTALQVAVQVAHIVHDGGHCSIGNTSCTSKPVGGSFTSLSGNAYGSGGGAPWGNRCGPFKRDGEAGLCIADFDSQFFKSGTATIVNNPTCAVTTTKFGFTGGINGFTSNSNTVTQNKSC